MLLFADASDRAKSNSPLSPKLILRPPDVTVVWDCASRNLHDQMITDCYHLHCSLVIGCICLKHPFG